MLESIWLPVVASATQERLGWGCYYNHISDKVKQILFYFDSDRDK